MARFPAPGLSPGSGLRLTATGRVRDVAPVFTTRIRERHPAAIKPGGRVAIMKRLSQRRLARLAFAAVAVMAGLALTPARAEVVVADRQVVAAHGRERRRHDATLLAGVDRPPRLRHAERRLPSADDGAALVLAKYYNSPMPHSIFFHRGYAIHGTCELRGSAAPPRTAASGCIRRMPRRCSRWSSATGRQYPDRDLS